MLDALYREPKEDTPKVIFDKQKGIFELTGKSLPENVVDFYQPLYDWLEQYIKEPNEETIIKLQIDYFNSASHKAINQLLEILALIQVKKVLVRWHYLQEDEDMLESGHDFCDLTGLKFEYISFV